MSEKNYIDFNEATLMAYINQELNEEQMGMVEHWLTLSEDNQAEMDKLKKIWDESKLISVTPVNVDTEKALSNVLSQIDTSNDKVIPIEKPTNFRRIILSAAAVLIALFGLVGLLNYINGSTEQINLTASSGILESELSDGTLVSLNENATLKYQDGFSSNERRVALEGEAFFDVERNEEKPFIIDLHHDSYVKVLGTSFNIDANDKKEETVVYVKTGKVEFGSDKNKVILVAGESGVMNNLTGEVEKRVDEYEEMKSMYWQTQELDFDGMKLSETIPILEAVFEVKIDLNCEERGESKMVSNHSHESLDEILKVIGSVHGLDVVRTRSSYQLNCD